MTDELDPVWWPTIPVLRLLGACDCDDADAAREQLHPDMVADMGDQFDDWWTAIRPVLAGEWDTVFDPEAVPDASPTGDPVHTVKLVRPGALRTEAGGVTAAGTPYVSPAGIQPHIGPRFLVTLTGDGWRIAVITGEAAPPTDAEPPPDS